MFKVSNFIIIVILFSLNYNTIFAQNKNNPAIDFSLPDIYGEQVNLFDTLAEGKTVLLYFFSCNCVHCYTMAPIVDSVFRRFGSGSENLTVWGIAQYMYNYEQISSFIDSTNISFRCFATGHETDVFGLYEISYTPQIIMICGDEVSEPIPQDMIVETLNYCFPTEIDKPTVNFVNVNIINKSIQIVADKDISLVRINDITGRLLLTVKNPGEITDFSNSEAGKLYILTIIFDDGTLYTSKIQAK